MIPKVWPQTNETFLCSKVGYWWFIVYNNLQWWLLGLTDLRVPSASLTDDWQPVEEKENTWPYTRVRAMWNKAQKTKLAEQTSCSCDTTIRQKGNLHRREICKHSQQLLNQPRTWEGREPKRLTGPSRQIRTPSVLLPPWFPPNLSFPSSPSSPQTSSP